MPSQSAHFLHLLTNVLIDAVTTYEANCKIEVENEHVNAGLDPGEIRDIPVDEQLDLTNESILHLSTLSEISKELMDGFNHGHDQTTLRAYFDAIKLWTKEDVRPRVSALTAAPRTLAEKPVYVTGWGAVDSNAGEATDATLRTPADSRQFAIDELSQLMEELWKRLILLEARQDSRTKPPSHAGPDIRLLELKTLVWKNHRLVRSVEESRRSVNAPRQDLLDQMERFKASREEHLQHQRDLASRIEETKQTLAREKRPFTVNNSITPLLPQIAEKIVSDHIAPLITTTMENCVRDLKDLPRDVAAEENPSTDTVMVDLFNSPEPLFYPATPVDLSDDLI